MKDILKYTVLSKRSPIQRSTYCTIPTGPSQKKYATPGTLNPDTSPQKKTTIICSRGEYIRACLRLQRVGSYKRGKGNPWGDRILDCGTSYKDV